MLCGGDTDSCAGDAERELGGFTATESAVDAAVDEEFEAAELVRRREAARRGRLPAVAGVGAFRLMRAASWFREGMRVPAEGRLSSDLAGASWVVAAGGGVVDIVGVDGQAHSSGALCSARWDLLDCITFRIPDSEFATSFPTSPVPELQQIRVRISS